MTSEPIVRQETNSPVRISRIGSDHLQVFIRSAHGYTELLALVERLERLVDAGYDAIDVVFEAAPRHLYGSAESASALPALRRPTTVESE